MEPADHEDKNSILFVTVFVVLKQHYCELLLSYKHVYLSWSDIPEVVVPMMISLVEGCC